jgi:hypothetical protein
MPRALARSRTFVLGVGGASSLAVLLSACGGPVGAANSASVKTTCQQIAAVLSDGPDPSADPIGYAEAQILPLTKVRTSDATLRRAVSDLDQAFRSVYSSEASASSERELERADSALDTICPGATG